MESIIQSLSEIDATTFEGDDTLRLRAVKASRELTLRLQKPFETMNWLFLVNPFVLIACKTAVDLDLFNRLSDEPQTNDILAQKTGCDPVLMARLTRILGVGGFIKEVDIDTFVHNEMSTALKSKTGLVNCLGMFYDMEMPQLARLPEYLKMTNYQNPIDVKSPPWHYVMQTEDSIYGWLSKRPQEQGVFHNVLSTMLAEMPHWTSVYPVERLLDGYDPSTALFVDLGCGNGRDSRHLVNALPEAHKHDRIILQDFASVVEQARKEMDQQNYTANFEYMAHDIFSEQPVKGARTYHLHSVLHNWPDKECIQILTRVREAMKPGYSRLLVNDPVVPASVREVNPTVAAMDLNMMSHCAALERTEKQFAQLFEAAGLKFTAFNGSKETTYGVMDVEVL